MSNRNGQPGAYKKQLERSSTIPHTCKLLRLIDMSNSTRKNVVIVGGGSGGATLTRILSKSLDASKYSLVLIDARESLVLTPATIRLPVANPAGLEDNVFIPLKDIFINGNGTFHQGTASAIDPTVGASAVVLDNGERIPYDVLVLSPGSTWYGSFDFTSDIKARWAADRENVKKAQNIVIVGAGAVGLGMFVRCFVSWC